MSVPKAVVDLVERFRRNESAYRSGQYNETQVRREFIDPFFECLGWDVNNRQGYAEAYKEVIHEDSLDVEGAKRAPDYCFRIGGTRKFFLEAKKPSVNVRDDISPAYQLRRYAWTAKLPLSILTDFEEFAVYDGRVKPTPTDKSATARVLFIPYVEYPDRWTEIASCFSKEAILQGAFDQFADTNKGKRGTATVDQAFLAEIESWRDVLARNIALRNPGLDQRGLNDAVQRTIDRIIFLRLCEDRGIEDYGRLYKCGEEKDIYDALKTLFIQADYRYNSGLFHFEPEKGRAGTDQVTLDLNIDDKILKPILRGLYYPDCPYEFSVMPPDILGHVYEQFLGKVIRLTPSHQAKVEEKPEVRKAGGVYYTPSYIVDYIVKHTVGALLEGKQPRDVDGSKKGAPPLRVLDPACGSGSFLIVAYQYLLDWYRDRYAADDPEKYCTGKNPKLRCIGGRDYALTVPERKRILLDHIYGVDIDPQAVEVTKLSLLLKVIEGESAASLGQNRLLFQERALPDLDKNIKCGNSLIGPEYYAGQQTDVFDTEELLRVNAFDWHAEFPEVFHHRITEKKQEDAKSISSVPQRCNAECGFDAVIGNPPYIRIQTMKEWAPLEVELYKQLYKSASSGNYDIYVVFIEQGLKLLNANGLLGFICPNKFFNSKYGEPLREIIAKGQHLKHVVHFGDQQVFTGATTYTCLLFLNKEPANHCQFVKVNELAEWRANGASTEGTIKPEQVTQGEWNFAVGRSSGVLARMADIPIKLGDIAHLFVGLQTDCDDVFIVEEIKIEGKRALCKSKATGEEHWFEEQHLKHFLKGSLNIRRYRLTDLTKRLIFPYEIREGKSVLITPAEYKNKYPLTWGYLEINHKRLAARNKGKMGEDWYGYVYKKNHTRFGYPKIVVPSLANGSCFSADFDGCYYFVGSGGGGGGGYGIILNENAGLSSYCLLGILNSKLISAIIKSGSTPFRGGYFALNRQYIEGIPIHPIDLNNPSDKDIHDRITFLVERLLTLNRQQTTATTDHERTLLERQITATDHQIDQLVYALYGLTEEEIALVEGEG